MILAARDRRLRFLSSRSLLLSFPSPDHLLPPRLLRTRPFPITLSCSRARARSYVATSTSLARSAKGLVHKFAIRENISADGQLRYREREEESERRTENAENCDESARRGRGKKRREDGEGREERLRRRTRNRRDEERRENPARGRLERCTRGRRP